MEAVIADFQTKLKLNMKNIPEVQALPRTE
jgi:hypothetical protein